MVYFIRKRKYKEYCSIRESCGLRKAFCPFCLLGIAIFKDILLGVDDIIVLNNIFLSLREDLPSAVLGFELEGLYLLCPIGFGP